MNSIAEAIKRGCDSLHKRLGQPSFTWRGNTFDCVPSTTRLGSMLEAGGIAAEVSLTLVVLKADFDVNYLVDGTSYTTAETQTLEDSTVVLKPSSGSSLITYGGSTYRVIRVLDAPDGWHWELDLEAA